MLFRRFSLPPATEPKLVTVPLLPLTSYWFMEPRRIENQRDSRENGSDEAIEGDDPADGGLVADEPGLMPRAVAVVEVAMPTVVGCAGEDVVLDIVGA